ncbi:hypothetical protein [Streptomyces sp. NPDC046161]|uniref:hypothetical protein n=1 Tax=Streptomyces sp. NPDC046161 TaxID=3155132 RepID=UPI003411B507
MVPMGGLAPQGDQADELVFVEDGPRLHCARGFSAARVTGLTNDQIADRLVVSIATVKTHLFTG